MKGDGKIKYWDVLEVDLDVHVGVTKVHLSQNYLV